MKELWMRRGLTLLAIGIASTCALIVVFIAMALHDGDPLDRFQVLSSVANGDGRQHAVVVSYHHADSSTQWQAVWLSDRPGLVGSANRWAGRPIAVWTDTPAVVLWRDGRWMLKVGANASRRSPAGACFFDYETRPLVCFDATQIAVVDR